ncbi:hypothetical protein VNO77_00407 [Canavalia gladiata]|uniref:Uncharacterized protein n=1 Tax=Canavalia gladiata TaxID=3824 RepID=A0AAN9MTX1_CANGL
MRSWAKTFTVYVVAPHQLPWRLVLKTSPLILCQGSPYLMPLPLEVCPNGINPLGAFVLDQAHGSRIVLIENFPSI